MDKVEKPSRALKKDKVKNGRSNPKDKKSLKSKSGKKVKDTEETDPGSDQLTSGVLKALVSKEGPQGGVKWLGVAKERPTRESFLARQLAMVGVMATYQPSAIFKAILKKQGSVQYILYIIIIKSSL